MRGGYKFYGVYFREMLSFEGTGKGNFVFLFFERVSKFWEPTVHRWHNIRHHVTDGV